jgi:phosphoglucosamine mutase
MLEARICSRAKRARAEHDGKVWNDPALGTGRGRNDSQAAEGRTVRRFSLLAQQLWSSYKKRCHDGIGDAGIIIMDKKSDNMNEKKLFGTDGVRGVANVEPVTAETALKLGRAAAYVFKRERQGRHEIVVGKDTRLSGYMLETAITAGALSMGVDVLLIGPLPTPGVAYITRSLRADAGIVLTASHNPYEDNGIKFFDRDGYKLDDAIEKHIEDLVFSGTIDSIRPIATEIGKATRIDDALGRYVEFAKASFPKGMTLEGLRVVVDAGNGAAYKTSRCVLRELGADVVSLNDKPNGLNINASCGSLFPDVIRRAVIEHKAQVGIAHDGDADRVLMADENGHLVDGDDILAIIALDYLANGVLKNNTLVATVMSNSGLDAAIQAAGGTIIRTPVGDRYVIEKMRELDCNLGGEPSGHIICRDYATTGDGIVCALQVLRIMKQRGKTLNQLAKCFHRFPQVTVNVRVREKIPFEELPEVARLVAETEKQLKADGGRLLLRYSGTEPLVRLLIEGRDKLTIERHAERIARVLKEKIGT